MPFEKFEDAEAIDNERRKAIAKSIRIISVEELKKLGEEIFDEPDRPWRQTFLSVVTENPGATFYHASAGEGVIFLYSGDDDKGLWYLPGSGLGPLSEGGRQLMKEAGSDLSPNMELLPPNLPDDVIGVLRRSLAAFSKTSVADVSMV